MKESKKSENQKNRKSCRPKLDLGPESMKVDPIDHFSGLFTKKLDSLEILDFFVLHDLK